jgi:hypothetical protein
MISYRNDELNLVYGQRIIFMDKTLLAAITATVLLASSAVPSSADYYRRGGGYGYVGGSHGGGWNGGDGAALGLGLGLGLLGGALATAPYYAAPYYAAPGYGYAPASAVPTTWYWCDPYQQYYPSVPNCPAAWRQVVH